MQKTFKQYATNRYCILGLIATALILGLCFKYGSVSEGIAIVLGVAAIGAAWLWMKSVTTPVVNTVCPCSDGRPVTTMAGHGPCGCRPNQSYSEFLEERRATHS